MTHINDPSNDQRDLEVWLCRLLGETLLSPPPFTREEADARNDELLNRLSGVGILPAQEAALARYEEELSVRTKVRDGKTAALTSYVLAFFVEPLGGPSASD